MIAEASLEALADPSGSIDMGWLGAAVLYTRMNGMLSMKVGGLYASGLDNYLRRAKGVRFFLDGSGLISADLLARSALIRVFCANRSTIASMVMLTGAENVGPIGKALAATLGEVAELMTDAEEFENRLIRAAPHARKRIYPESGSPLRRSSEPLPVVRAVG
jgi:hypothetical protein